MRGCAALYGRYQRAIDANTPSTLAMFRLGRLQYRRELVDASVMALQEEIREDKVKTKAPEPAVAVARAVAAARAVSRPATAVDALLPSLGPAVKPKSKSPPPSPRIEDQQQAVDGNDSSCLLYTSPSPRDRG